MSVYFIADIKVTDDKWIPDYAISVHDIVHADSPPLGPSWLSQIAGFAC